MPATATTSHPSVRQGKNGSHADIDTGERWASGLLGATIAAAGMSLALKHRAITTGLLLAGGGALLVNRGVSGRGSVRHALGLGDGAAIRRPSWTRGIHTQHSVTIDRPADDLYQFWRDPANLPHFMIHVESVTPLNNQQWRWMVKTDGGRRFEWNTHVTADDLSRRIDWRSEDKSVAVQGSAAFIPVEGRGTRVKIVLDYHPVGGRLTALAAKALGEEPGQLIRQDLRRFKSLMEAGEAPSIEGQPRGQCAK